MSRSLAPTTPQPHCPIFILHYPSDGASVDAQVAYVESLNFSIKRSTLCSNMNMVAKVARRSLGGRPSWRVYSESTRPCRPTFSEYSESTRPFTLLGTIPCSEYSEYTRPCKPTFTTLNMNMFDVSAEINV